MAINIHNDGFFTPTAIVDQVHSRYTVAMQATVNPHVISSLVKRVINSCAAQKWRIFLLTNYNRLSLIFLLSFFSKLLNFEYFDNIMSRFLVFLFYFSTSKTESPQTTGLI